MERTALQSHMEEVPGFESTSMGRCVHLGGCACPSPKCAHWVQSGLLTETAVCLWSTMRNSTPVHAGRMLWSPMRNSAPVLAGRVPWSDIRSFTPVHERMLWSPMRNSAPVHAGRMLFVATVCYPGDG